MEQTPGGRFHWRTYACLRCAEIAGLQVPFNLYPFAPMNCRGPIGMQVMVDVTDEMRREAEARGLAVVDYVELLLAQGRDRLNQGSSVSGAIERIRALRGGER